MAIVEHKKNYLKAKLDVGIYSDEQFQKRLFTPFLKEKTYDGTGIEYYDELFKEYSAIELEIAPNSTGTEILFGAVNNVRSLTIHVRNDDPTLFIQPDLDIYFDSTDNQKFSIRGLLHMNFSTGPTKIIVDNPTVYKKIFKIVYCGG